MTQVVEVQNKFDGLVLLDSDEVMQEFMRRFGERLELTEYKAQFVSGLLPDATDAKWDSSARRTMNGTIYRYEVLGETEERGVYVWGVYLEDVNLFRWSPVDADGNRLTWRHPNSDRARWACEQHAQTARWDVPVPDSWYVVTSSADSDYGV